MGDLTEFDIEVHPGGHGHIIIDGVEQQYIQAVRIEAAVRDVPRVYLERIAGVARIKGEAVVEYTLPDRDQRELMVDFLDNLDPDEVEKDVLAACGGLDGPSTGEAFLAVLKGYVRGDDNGT